MIRLQLVHPTIQSNQSTYLTKQANVGDTLLNVADTAGFAKGDLILIGNYGSETTEIAQVSSTVDPTTSTVTLENALKFSHTTNSRVTVMDYDKLQIFRSDTQYGIYTQIDTVDIAVDEETTAYRDSTGDLDKWYKIRYENSITSAVSSYSSPLSSTGYTENSVVVLLIKAKKQFSKYSDRLIDRDTWIGWLNEGYRIMINRIANLGWDWGTKKGNIISLIANTEEYELPGDFLKTRRFWIRYTTSGKYTPAERMDFSLYNPNYTYSQLDPHYFFRGKKIVIVPKPTVDGGDILPFYYYLPPNLVYDSDTLDENYILASKAYILTNYTLQKALEMDKRFEEAAYFGQTFENQMDLMVKEMSDRYPEMPGQIGENELGQFDTSYPFN